VQERSLASRSATARCDVFLSYRGRDREFVAQIAERLRGAGLDPWFDQWSLTAGKRWQRELEDALAHSRACAVFVGASDLLSVSTGQAPVGDVSAWQREELDVALNRAVREPGFRVIPVLLPGVGDPFDPNELPAFLSTRTWVDFRRGTSDRRALQDLINATRGVPVGAHSAVCRREVKAPYRGLRAFDEQDADVFFGRDSELQRLVEMLKSRRFVAVIGASGCGKSSLVRAGLVPWLRANVAGGGPDAPIVMLRPGAAPLAALAAQLASLHPGRAMGATLDA
jgi:nucleotide-binding universal stress UspA family protein